ncbi:MAG TPA: LLM class flavin-dependent oxidoreductase [Anaerolineales bacterium]|nr:LLM class flavin-dependent oxidoreductase [Anaerolineales bacterium]
MEIGFCLSTFGTRYIELREAAQQIESLGYASIHVWDHYVAWPDPQESVLEAWTTLAGLAEVTQRLRLGPLVANILNRHPGRLAKVAATLQELSGGRCDLAIGSGSGGEEQESFGITVGDTAERIARFEEALQIIPELWKGKPVMFRGEYYSLTNAICMPAQNPPPRLIGAATLPASARLAGKYADGVNFPWVVNERFPTLFDSLEEGLAESGRYRKGFDVSLHVRWHVLGSDPLQAMNQWKKLGFTRVIIYLSLPFPLAEIETLALALD